MSDKTTDQRFGATAIALHWLAAMALVLVLGLAWTLEWLDRGPTKDMVLTSHKSTGIVIFVLMWARLLWRFTHPVPPWPDGMALWQRAAAGVTHVLLYITTLTMPVTGYVATAARGRETLVFGLFPLPRWVPLDRSLSLVAEQAHDFGQYVLYALALAHIGAAAYHQLILKDGVLARMWPFPLGQSR